LVVDEAKMERSLVVFFQGTFQVGVGVLVGVLVNVGVLVGVFVAVLVGVIMYRTMLPFPPLDAVLPPTPTPDR
jgi:uncharacterized oligopeptide transporter (OPT) family protein